MTRGTWHVPAACATRAGSWRMWPGPLRCVWPPIATIPPPNKIGRRGFQWWCSFAVLDTANRVLYFKWCGGAERVNKNVGPLASVWRCVPPPTMGLAPLLSRLDDDLCNGGLGCWIQTSEREVQRLLRLGREWWRVGSKVVGSNSACERVKTPMVMIFQGFVD